MVLLHVVYQALQVEQGGVALVGVVDVGLDAEPIEHVDAADAEQVLLLHAVLPVAAVELMGNLSVPFAVHLEVGVEQV